MEIISESRLSYTLLNQSLNSKLNSPEIPSTDLPEKILQFGTGVLLRGLPDYFVDKANREGIFNGRIVVVKSTDSGDSTVFEKQDNLYTLCVRGVENEENIEENIICSSISRVLSAKSQWDEVLTCARNRELQIIISNTTEVGIQLVQDDVGQTPPVSFPGKLLAFLYERYKAFEGSKEHGFVIVPTELIPDNGKLLESIVLELAHRNGLEEPFIDWVENSNYFCNSLVDRIVPGTPDAAAKQKIEEELGYRDDLITMAEVYRLWAIEGDEHVKSVLSFWQADEGVVIDTSIEIYRELKLRLLNGSHTLSCGLAFLAGFKTVREAMESSAFTAFIKCLMLSELAPAIPYKIPEKTARRFCMKVLDRFKNPHIEHNWISITAQFSSKMRTRTIPILLNYYKTFDCVPEYYALGFAAYIFFMKSVKKENGVYWGESNGKPYPINDAMAEYFNEKWQVLNIEDLVTEVMKDKSLWGSDLSLLPGFPKTVTLRLNTIMEEGASAVLKSFLRRNA